MTQQERNILKQNIRLGVRPGLHPHLSIDILHIASPMAGVIIWQPRIWTDMKLLLILTAVYAVEVHVNVQAGLKVS